MVKIALITGGSRGLGRASVLSLAKRGIYSIFTYNSSADAANKVIEDVKAAGSDGIALPLDVSKPDTIDAFIPEVKEALKTWGAERIDYLVNNAGIGSHSSAENVTVEELDLIYNIHFKSVVVLTQKLLPIINDGGRILNVSTGLTRWVLPGFIAYSSIKSAVETYTRYLAVELGPRQIRANVLAPGAIETDFGGGAVRNHPEFAKIVGETIALGRVGQPDDIGDAVAALLGDDLRWFNGERIEIAGGQKL